MPEDEKDGLAESPKDAVTGHVHRPSESKAPPAPDNDAEPAGQRNSAHQREESEGADHDTEEAAAYRENDA